MCEGMLRGDGIDESEPELQSSANVGRKRSDMIHMKILVPSGAVGAIIGKGGRSIAQVQSETGARIKLSKPNDFYPGTTERVCLIQGSLEGVTQMHNYIMDRMLEKPECATPLSGPNIVPSTGRPGLESEGGTSSDSSGLLCSSTDASVSPSWTVQSGNRLVWGRHQQVKILVPNCTAGLVIGKLGSYVKEIKDRTKAFIQISQKSKEINLLERCITIAGEPDQCRAAVDLVLAKIAEDPQSTNCPTISYSRVQGPVASAYPTGSPFAFATTAALQTFPTQLPQTSNTDEQSQQGYMPLTNPYASPMLQAALLQAAAAATALNPRAYYSPQASPSAHAAFFSAPASQQHQSNPADSDTRNLTDSGVYTPTSSAHLISALSTNVWPGCDLAWSPTLADPSTGSANLPCGQAAFDPAYQTPFNFAYYPTNPPVLTPVLTQAPTETFTVNPELYSSSSYATPVSISGPPAFRATSPGPGYPNAYVQTATEVMQTPPNMVNLTQPTIPLSDLFGSLRLSHPAFVDYTGSREMNPFYPTAPYATALPTQGGITTSVRGVANSGRPLTGYTPMESTSVDYPAFSNPVSGSIATQSTKNQHSLPSNNHSLTVAPSCDPASHVPCALRVQSGDSASPDTPPQDTLPSSASGRRNQPISTSSDQFHTCTVSESHGADHDPDHPARVSQNGNTGNNAAKQVIISNCSGKQQQCLNGQTAVTLV